MNRSVFRFPTPAAPLSFDGERYVSGLLGNVASGDIQSEHYHRYLFALSYCAGKDVLDVASGEGYGSSCLGQVARSVLGVDANNEAVVFANSNYLSERVSFRQGKAQNLPVDSQSIDVVVSFESLEHFAEHDLFAKEIQRVLRPNGLLIISSPNRTIYSEAANYHNEFHLKELDRDEFVLYLRTYFANVALFGQRPLVGSVIGSEEDLSSGKPEGFIWQGPGLFERTIGTPYPPFFVALASDADLPATHSSVLHNPALLRHIDELRQQSASELEQRRSQVGELEQILASRTQQVGELEQVLASRTQQVGELEQALASQTENLHQLRRISGNTTGKISALRANTFARIAVLRSQLEDSRQRCSDLLSELGSERALTANLRNEMEGIQLRNASLFTALEHITNSTTWRATGRLRNIVSRLRPEQRRLLRWSMKLLWQTATLQFVNRAPLEQQLASSTALIDDNPQSLTISRPISETSSFSPIPLLASQQQVMTNSTWILPKNRAEFIRLRSMVPRARIAAVVHIYYVDLWPEIAEALLNIEEPFDLFVTLIVGVSEHISPRIMMAFPTATILTVDNHGRDIFPFVEIIRSGVLFKYELVCKLHSKRTEWRAGGEEWRQHLIRGILGSTETVDRILNAFASDPDLGIVVADRQIFRGREFWASNEHLLIPMLRKIGLDASSFEKGFVGGSIYWIRPFMLRSINALDLGFDDFEPEPLSNDGTMAHAVERLVSLVCYDAGMRIADVENLASESLKHLDQPVHVHLIANYLPQFHPIPENNAWWGCGFTEWTNVSRATPLFAGHRQPRLPSDLGFYDLRLAEIRQAQADLAKSYGVTAFSYYYYWFNGRRLLERPLNEVLSSGVPDFPFMICWANEPWSRNWDGLSKEVLVSQDYEPGWEDRFANDIAPLLRDPRYLRLNGRPVLAIYRMMHIPGPAEAMKRLRACLNERGIPDVHLIGGWLRVGDDAELPLAPEELSLDAYFEFPPHGLPAKPLSIGPSLQVPGFAANIADYGATVDAVIDQLASGSEGFRYRGVMAGWDNTARRGRNAYAFHGATPTSFRRWIRAAVNRARVEACEPETAIFINAWNEWAEGTYLEPDKDFGCGWLEAVASGVGKLVPEPRTE